MPSSEMAVPDPRRRPHLRCKAALLALIVAALTSKAFGGETNRADFAPSDSDFGFAPDERSAGMAGSPSVEGGAEVSSPSGGKEGTVKRMWGVSDTVAVVGRPLRVDVPKDAFAGDVERYEAYSPGNSPLPSWLALTDPKHGRLEGVPGPSDVGELYVTLKAVASSKKRIEFDEAPEMAKDVFVIEVLPMPPWPSSSNGKGVCVSPLLVSVVLDADFNHLGAQSRARVVGAAASSFLGVAPGALTLRSQLKEDRPDPGDGSVLAAGPGDASAMSSTTKKGAVLEWQIGCNGHIWKWKEPESFNRKELRTDKDSKDGRWSTEEVNGDSVGELRHRARDGSLSDILGIPVLGWRVRTVGVGRSSVPRETRNARPLIRIRRESGSGDFENGDDEEDEDSDDEMPSNWDTDSWDGDYGMEEKTVDRVPETRIIPTMASPVFAEPTAVTIGSMGDSSHPHRHHHGEGDEDDEEEDYDTYPAVASGRNVLVTSPVPVYGTILPTPVLIPARPTRFPSLDEDGSIESSHFDELGGIPDATPSLAIATSSYMATSLTSPSIAPSPTLWITTSSATVNANELSPVVTEPLQPTTAKDAVEEMGGSSSTTTSTEEPVVVSSEEYETPKSTVPTRSGGEEEVVIDTKNFAPTIHHRLRKIPVTAGTPLRYVIPEDIFTDFEDGNTRNLRLIFKTAEGKMVPQSSWVQFNPETQEVYALPLEEHVSKWDFIVEAMDREGSSVSDTLELLVQHHKGRRAFHHEFSLVLHLEKKFDFPSDVDWQLRVLDGLRRLFGDDSIVVTAVGHQQKSSTQLSSHQGTLVFSWTNDTLPRTDCPKTDIEKLFQILALNDAGEPSSALKDVLSPEFKVKRVSYKGNGQCEGIGAGEEVSVPGGVPPGKGGVDRGKETAHVPPMPPPSTTNTAPKLRNQVDHINATIGKLLIFRVPEDTFYDEEDGSTRNLKLSLLTMDRTAISANNWLQFDPRNQEFFGVPFPPDRGRKEYQLVCEDSGGLMAHDGLVVAVHDIPAMPPSTRRRPLPSHQQPPSAHAFHSVEFVATLSTAHEAIESSATLKRKFIERLATLFGDRDTSSILLFSVGAGEDDGAEDEDGSTVITWFNTTLPVDKCPEKEVARLRRVLVYENGGPGANGISLSPRVRATFGHELPIRSIDIVPINICQGELTVIHFPEVSPGVIPDEDEDSGDNGPSSTTSSSSDEYLITFIVPAVVIAAMLLLAGLIACGLYRRRRRGKLSVAEKRAGSNVGGGPLLAGANRGIPVIFQDELEERPPDPAKSPVIMKDEKPPLPLPPPDYQTAPNGGSGGTLGGPQGMGNEPHTGTPLLSQGPRHGSGGPRRRGRREDMPGGGMPGDDDSGERGVLMGGRGMRGDEEGEEEEQGMAVGGASSPPYHPPPPFTTNRDSGRGSRPKPTPTYRKPPPYVPP